jgi:sarcosine oxidase
MNVCVIGAGVFGAWCAKFLADDGHQIELVDAYGPANGRASSADFSRVIRAGYGPDRVYSQWAAAAWSDWEWLSRAAGQTLLTRTGALFLGEPSHPYIAATYATLTGLGIAAEWLTTAQLATRYPQMSVDGLGDAIFELGAGVIRARAAIRALVGVLLDSRRVRFRQDAVEALDEQRAVPRIHSRSGEAIDADVYVFACGPWLPTLFPAAVGSRIRPTRQEVLYFGTPAGNDSYSAPRLPVWIDFPAGLYGIPDLDGCGFKVGIDRHGETVDPDVLERVIDPAMIASTRQSIARRFPGLGTAPLVDARVCQYENTSAGDFLIDRHPQWPECWIVGGGSGHGFKHGPSLGRYVAALVSGRAAVEPRFAFATKTAAPQRAVY